MTNWWLMSVQQVLDNSPEKAAKGEKNSFQIQI